MYLQTNNHVFFVKHDKYKDDIHFYSIGNPNNKPKACITISVMKVKDAIIMTLQDIEYYQTCSANTLEKGLGTVEMLQGSIRAIMKRHPDISRIDLQDKSFFTLPNKDNIPLPEYRLLTKGLQLLNDFLLFSLFIYKNHVVTLYQMLKLYKDSLHLQCNDEWTM